MTPNIRKSSTPPSVLPIVTPRIFITVLDFLIFGVMQGSYTKWWLVIIVGLIWFVIYYLVFKTVILKFDLKTPGRTVEKNDNNESNAHT